MKSNWKYSLLIVFSIFIFNQASAQLGIKAGYNLSSLNYFADGDTNFNEEFISGYQLGLVYRLGLGDKISFQPEVAYYTNGGNSQFFNTAVERTYQNVKANGLINYNLIGNNDGLSLQLTGGIFGGYAVSAEVGLDGMEKDKVNFDEDRLRRTNVGYIFGAGIKFNSFIFSVRGSIGTSELLVFQTDGMGSAFDANVKSREFSFIGIYLF